MNIFWFFGEFMLSDLSKKQVNGNVVFRIPMRNILMFFIILLIIILIFNFVFFVHRSNLLEVNILIRLLVFYLLNFSLPLFCVWYCGVMEISDVGICLYRVNNLIWNDITEAKKIKIFGLPYIRITKKQGMDWYLPLYFRGPIAITEKLTKSVPPENPLYKIVY